MSIFKLLGAESVAPPLSQDQSCRVLSVWGSSGSGKTTIASNLAFELSSLGRRTLLIDADSYSPGVAPALGITEPGPGILAALRLARQQRLDSAELTRLTKELAFESSTLKLLSGISAQLRWSEFDAPAIQTLIGHARTEFDFVVVDLASPLEPGLYAPESSVSRNQATLSFIENSEVVLGCFLADPVGVNRFLWDVRLAGFNYWPIANRVRSQVLGKNPDRQLKDAIHQLTKRELNHILPEDSAAADSALCRAQPLIVAARNSKLRDALRRLALDVIDGSTKLPKREH